MTPEWHHHIIGVGGDATECGMKVCARIGDSRSAQATNAPRGQRGIRSFCSHQPLSAPNAGCGGEELDRLLWDRTRCGWILRQVRGRLVGGERNCCGPGGGGRLRKEDEEGGRGRMMVMMEESVPISAQKHFPRARVSHSNLPSNVLAWREGNVPSLSPSRLAWPWHLRWIGILGVLDLAGAFGVLRGGSAAGHESQNCPASSALPDRV